MLCKAVLLEPFSDGKFKTYTFSHYWNKGTTDPSELVTGKAVNAKWHVAIGNAGQIDATKQIDWWELSPIRVSSKYRSDSSKVVGKSDEYMRDSYTFEFPPDSIQLAGGYPLAIVMWAEWGSDTDTLSTGCWQLEEGTCCSTLTSQFLYSPDFKGNPTAPTPSSGDSSKLLATTEFVANAIKGASAPIDYPVAVGTCDFWTYVMWNSGIAECWGHTGNATYSVDTPWGALYESWSHWSYLPGGYSDSAYSFREVIDGQEYTQLFVDTPEIHTDWMPSSDSSSGISGIEKGVGAGPLRTEAHYLLRPTTGTCKGCWSYIVKGRWK